MGIFRDDILAGKVALVTGGGSGICRGIAEAFAAHGAKVAIVGRNGERLAAVAEELSGATGREVIPCVADVRDVAQVQAAVAEAVSRLGSLELVVNGAAGNFLCPAAGLSSNGLRTVLEIDALGTWHVCRAAFDAWLQAHGGHIINISATLHYGATPFQLHPSAAKAAVDAMTRNLAVEWGGLGIRVNGIAPGPIGDTEGMKRLAPGEVGARLKAAIPLGRFGTIDEIANTALFLASDAAPYITGETVVVDGGHWLVGGGLMG